MKQINSQALAILVALKKGKKITPLKALKEFGCLRLGARIWDLKRMGHKIESDLVERDGKHVAQYYMKFGKGA
jgi:hypothetical protein